MKFCYYCCELYKRGSLHRHCKDAHSADCRALKKDERPADPKYRNWEEWVKDPANTIPRFQRRPIPTISINPERPQINIEEPSSSDNEDRAQNMVSSQSHHIEDTVLEKKFKCGCANSPSLVKRTRLGKRELKMLNKICAHCA